MTWRDDLIADIMAAQQRLQYLFADDRSDPLFSSHLTLSQLRILMLLSRTESMSARELAERIGVGPAALTGMVDRLVANDLVIRHEDPHDRRVRRIRLSAAGTGLIRGIITAGAEKQRRLLSRLSADDLAQVAAAVRIMVRAAEAMSGQPEGGRRGEDVVPDGGR